MIQHNESTAADGFYVKLVFNKLVLTALKFTPVVLAKHMPYKVSSHGKL